MNSTQSEGTILEDKPSLIVDQLAKPKVNLPLDVTTELSQYTKFYITKGQDFFRIVCCCEDYFQNIIYMVKCQMVIKNYYFHVVDILYFAIVVDAPIVVLTIAKEVVCFVYFVVIYVQILYYFKWITKEIIDVFILKE